MILEPLEYAIQMATVALMPSHRKAYKIGHRNGYQQAINTLINHQKEGKL